MSSPRAVATDSVGQEGRHVGEEWKIVKPDVNTVSLPGGETAGEEWKIVKPVYFKPTSVYSQ